MNFNELITEGIARDCDLDSAQLGSEKDLYLFNYTEFNRTATLASGNIEVGGDNPGGIIEIMLNGNPQPKIFEGKMYSNQPNYSAEQREDGITRFGHGISFTVFDKLTEARNAIRTLGSARVIAVVVDRSTGLYELFGTDVGLELESSTRSYNGSSDGNFYQIALRTPSRSKLKETDFPKLCTTIGDPIASPIVMSQWLFNPNTGLIELAWLDAVGRTSFDYKSIYDNKNTTGLSGTMNVDNQDDYIPIGNISVYVRGRNTYRTTEWTTKEVFIPAKYQTPISHSAFYEYGMDKLVFNIHEDGDNAITDYEISYSLGVAPGNPNADDTTVFVTAGNLPFEILGVPQLPGQEQFLFWKVRTRYAGGSIVSPWSSIEMTQIDPI